MLRACEFKCATRSNSNSGIASSRFRQFPFRRQRHHIITRAKVPSVACNNCYKDHSTARSSATWRWKQLQQAVLSWEFRIAVLACVYSVGRLGWLQRGLVCHTPNRVPSRPLHLLPCLATSAWCARYGRTARWQLRCVERWPDARGTCGCCRV